MENIDRREELIKLICDALPEADNTYTFKYPNIPCESKVMDICRRLEMPKEFVIFANASKFRDQFTIITKRGIIIKSQYLYSSNSTENEQGCVLLSWKDIKKIVYSKDFYIYEEDSYWHLGKYDFIGSGEVSSTTCEAVAEALTKCSQMFKSDMDTFEELYDVINGPKYRCGLCGNLIKKKEKPCKCPVCEADSSWIFEDVGDEYCIFNHAIAKSFFVHWYHPGIKFSLRSPDSWIWRIEIEELCKPYVENFGEEKAKKIVDAIATRHARFVIEHPLRVFYSEEELDRLKNKKIITKFLETVKNWFLANGDDCSIPLRSSDSHMASIREGFRIGLDEEILFMRDTSFWSNCNQGLVITDKGLYFIPDNDSHSGDFFIAWSEFNEVKYKELTLYFNDFNGNNIATLGWRNFFKTDNNVLTNSCIALANSLSEIASVASEDNPYKFLNEGNYDKALEIADELVKQDSKNYNSLALKGLILCERELNKDDEANSDNLVEALDYFVRALKFINKDDIESRDLIYDYKGRIELFFEKYEDARNSFILALDENDDVDSKDRLTDLLSECEDKMQPLWDEYVSQVRYKQRKYIMPVKDAEIGGCVVDDINVFRISNMPPCIQFTSGDPVANQLYIGHPYNNRVYVPIDDADELFFVDRAHELCYLLECLGAEEINITSIKGKNVTEMEDAHKSTTASTDVKLFSGEGGKDYETHYEGEASMNSQRSMRISLDPMRKPFVPEGLIWYAEQPQWQRLVNSRLNGNMLEYSEYLSTSQTKLSSASEIKNVKASAKYLWVKVKGDVDSNISSQFKESTETQWKIDVKFRSMKSFNENCSSINVADEAEQEYISELKDLLSDGEINSRERKLLEKIRQKLCISEERAHELEMSITVPSLTSEEEEYLNEYKEIISEGEISERDRKYLEKLKKANGISEDRAIELEKLI